MKLRDLVEIIIDFFNKINQDIETKDTWLKDNFTEDEQDGIRFDLYKALEENINKSPDLNDLVSLVRYEIQQLIYNPAKNQWIIVYKNDCKPDKVSTENLINFLEMYNNKF